MRRASFALTLVLFGCSQAKVERVEWPAMGTVAALQARGPSARSLAAADRSRVQGCFKAVERLLNAHDPASEIRRLASLPDGEVLSNCTASVRGCYAAAFRLADESAGAFSPRWRGAGTLDLGAIAKGFAVDLASGLCQVGGEGDAELLDLGGNLKSVRGTWRIGIAGSDEVVVLTNGMACATSAEYYRGKHIRDGRTGLAVTNAVASVTVVHPTSAMLADGLSTALFVLGPEEGEAFLRRCHPEAMAYWVFKSPSSR